MSCPASFFASIQSLSEKPCPPLQTEWRLQIARSEGSVQAAIHNLSPEQQQEVANHLLSNTTMEGVHLIHPDGHTLTTVGKTNLNHLVACNHPANPFQHDSHLHSEFFLGKPNFTRHSTDLLETIDSPLETCIELFSGAGHFLSYFWIM